jgi:hypothetical protein
MYCSDFEWHRRHQLKAHLEKQHGDVDLFAALDEATRSRRKATKIKNHLRPQRAIEYARWGCVESWPHQSMPPKPTVTEITPVFPLDMSFADYDPQPESAELALKKFKYAYSTLPSTKERASLETDLSTSARSVEVWSVNAFIYTVFMLSDPSTIPPGFRIKNSQPDLENPLPPPSHPTRNRNLILRPHLWISERPGPIGYRIGFRPRPPC